MITVVGAGPVGLVTALLAARAGMDVQVLEQRRKLPIDKACGEGLMPGGVEILRDLNVDIDQDGCSPFVGVRWIDELSVAEGRFPAGPGLGLRRVHLHRGLWEAARREGVPVHLGARVTGLSPEGVLCSEGLFSSRWILAADGLHSGLRKLGGLSLGPGPRPRFGLRRHYAVSPWTDFVEVHWAPGVEAYVTPVGPRRVGVAFLWSGEKAHFDQLLERFPRLQRRLEGAPVDSQDLGAGPLHQRVSSVVSGRLALVGDAAGYLDALTGEGLSLGFQQAASLVRAIQAGDLRFYVQEHAELVRLPLTMMHLLLFAARNPPLRARLIRSLSSRPDTFGRLLALNDGASLSSLGLGRVLSLGAGMVVWGALLQPQPRAEPVLEPRRVGDPVAGQVERPGLRQPRRQRVRAGLTDLVVGQQQRGERARGERDGAVVGHAVPAQVQRVQLPRRDPARARVTQRVAVQDERGQRWRAPAQ